ncbi:putative amidohydrolase YtcJ [Leucobacter exalbidus]|uniref:Amidohydrolase YtcJ n=1 Tax=Leucobacter exalbidus TaxID=662960 RepID=A0A940T0J2_9MICO|nr:putative amidohydrolase YtcJ [Leucobacter exalbidus]
MVHTLYLHPNIRTLDGANDAGEVHGAMLVADGIIVALGTPDELRGQSPTGTVEVTLPGEIVLPGFHDAHIHTGNLAREIDAPDLRGCATLDEALDRLRAYEASHPGTDWVLGGRWDRNA